MNSTSITGTSFNLPPTTFYQQPQSPPIAVPEYQAAFEEVLHYNQRVISEFLPRTRQVLDLIRPYLKNSVPNLKRSEVDVGRHIEELVKQLLFEEKIAEALREKV